MSYELENISLDVAFSLELEIKVRPSSVEVIRPLKVNTAIYTLNRSESLWSWVWEASEECQDGEK